jgi:uncharacterized membrane protein YgaE (UPF0421/DUF939 family)
LTVGGRDRARRRALQRTALIAGGLAVLTILLLLSGHWVLAIIVGVPAAVAVWVWLQARTVR